MTATNPIRVLQWGLGAMGQGMAKLITAKDGLELVGAIDVNPALDGKDIGEVLGIDPQVHVERPGLSRPVGSKRCFIRSAIWAATGSGSRTGWAVVAQTVPTPMLATNSPSTTRSA